MKKALLLFAALLVAGCGEKSSSEGSESAGEKPTPSNESAEPSADTAKPSPAETPVAESPSEEPSETPKSLSDADVERLLKEAVDMESLEERDGLAHQPSESEPFSGWAKMIHDSGQVQGLGQFKDGKQHGLLTVWADNGQKVREGTFKDGKLISEKYWNSKGEEVETADEANSEGATEPGEPSSDATEDYQDDSLSDADVERLLKEAVDWDSLEERDDLIYQNNEPFSGWRKMMYDSGQVLGLVQLKDGKQDGLMMTWYEDGRLASEDTWDNGELVAVTVWMPNGEKCPNTKCENGNGIVYGYWENGQKQDERTYKDGKEVSVKWWNSKGEEVERTLEGLGSVVPVPEPNPDSNVLKGKTFGKFTILDEVQTDGGDRSLAKKNAENTLVKYPEVEAMVGLWAYNAPQCIEALKDANKLGEVKVFSFDEDPVTLAAIKEGHCEGTVVQDPYNFGYQSMKYLKEIVVDDRMPDLNEGKSIPVPTRTIVKDNIAEFLKATEDRLAAGEAARNATPPADAPKFAFITNVAAPFWSHAEAGCYVAAKEFGVAVEFQMNSAATIAGQKRIVENILNKGECKGIAISILNPPNQTEMINNAAEQVPVITVDSDAPDSKRLFFLGFGNYEAGRELGKLIRKSMPEGGTIMLYVGKIDQPNSIQRRDGLLDELSGQIRTDD